MTATETIHLTSGDSICEIAPALGGSILRLSVAGAELLRRAPPGADSIQRVACFPLIPFANRIARGRLEFQGRDVSIELDPDGDPHALHGHGWRRGWQVSERHDDRARITLDYLGEDWPWPYRAEQTIVLRPGGIEIEIAVQNRHPQCAMPTGVGIHPFFSRATQNWIAADAGAWWRNDETGLATEMQVDDRFSADRPCAVADLEGLDNFFASDGDIVVDHGTRVGGDRTVGFHVYVPTGRDFFCVEPVSHVPNSFGRREITPDDLIAAGASKSWRFSIRNTAPRPPTDLQMKRHR